MFICTRPSLILTDQVRIFTHFVMSIKRTDQAHAKMNYLFIAIRNAHAHHCVYVWRGEYNLDMRSFAPEETVGGNFKSTLLILR